MSNTLFLRLEGPLQSWGERARWSERDTAPEPTKSGVVGLLACALGVNDDEGLRRLSQDLQLGVRLDRPGERLVDYQTVKERMVVSNRAYLCDASFLAAVQGAEALIARLAQAVQNPHWPVYLGRKSCPPSLPVYAGVGDFPSLEAALRWKLDGPVQAVLECGPDDGVRRRDAFDARSRRTYLPRYSRTILLLPEHR